MTFNIQGKQINISDDVISNYRKAVGLLPDMKTDDKWLETFFLETFDMEADEVLATFPIPHIEKELSGSIQYDTEQYNALGGGYFQ